MTITDLRRTHGTVRNRHNHTEKDTQGIIQ